MKIVTHRNAFHLAKKLGIPIARVKRKRFPDGEIYFRLLEPVDEPIVLATMYPNQNDSLVEILEMIDAVEEPIVVLAYMAYARQDREFLPGEAVSSRAILRAIRSSAREIFVVEPHSSLALHNIAKPIYVHETLGERISKHVEDPLLVSPDFGRSELVERIAKAFGFDYAFLKKYRDRETGEIVTEGEIDARGRNVVIVDDIVSTGGTLENAINKISDAESIHVVVVHGLFVESAYRRIKASIATTDTILTPFSVISVAKDILKAITT